MTRLACPPKPRRRWMTLLGLLFAACGGAGADLHDAAHDAIPDTAVADAANDLSDLDADLGPEADDHRSFVAVTFNTGTSEGLADVNPDDAYTTQMGVYSDLYYGDGLAWTEGLTAVAAFFAEVDPDVVTFQEIFWPGECPGIPAEARVGFVCETWQPGDPTVAEAVLGEGWQVMCHVGKPDKCAAVNRRFGSFRGCDADFCLEGMFGSTVEDCGKGARIGRGVIDLVGGGALTLVGVHGSSGFGLEEQGCRVKQFEQIFVDLGDGAPAASGELNLVLGDFNTDPFRLTGDPSGKRLLDFVGPGRAFHFVSEAGVDAPPTYAAFNIDHVFSDHLAGSCWHAGVDEGHEAVLPASYFDHKPAVCTLTFPER